MGKNKNKQHRYSIYTKYNFTCNYCNLRFNRPIDWDEISGIHEHGMFLEIDHIKPLSKGGEDTIENKQALCASCNIKKSDKYPFNEKEIIR